MDSKNWIFKLQIKYRKIFKYSLVSSFMLFGLPYTCISAILSIIYKEKVLTSGILFGLLWLSLAPFLIEYGYRKAEDFFEKSNNLFANEVDCIKIKNSFFNLLKSSKYLWISIPYGILSMVVLAGTIYCDRIFIVKVWVSFATFSIVFIAGFGFWGIICLLKMVSQIVKTELIVNPYHPDRFGGLKPIASFAIRVGTLFSTGALCFPLAYEVATCPGQNTWISYLFYSVLLFFLAFLLASFYLPLNKLKEKANLEKINIIAKSESILQDMVNKYILYDKTRISVVDLMKVYLYNQQHSRLFEMRSSPIELKMAIEIFASILVPIVALIIQMLIGSKK